MNAKEEIYDEQISPLMGQIIAICREHKIANICSFSLDYDEELVCTTAMLKEEFEPPESFLEALKTIRPPEREPLMVTTKNPDGSETITAIL